MGGGMLGCSVVMVWQRDKTAVMFAAESGHKHCLQLLIAAGANLEHKDKACNCSCARLLMGVREGRLINELIDRMSE